MKTGRLAQLNIIVLLVFTIILCFIDNCSYYFTCVLTYIDVVLCLLIFWKKGYLGIRNPIFLFWVITTIFSLGQNLAYPFITDESLVKNTLLYRFKYDAEEMLLGSKYTMQALNLLTIGLVGKRRQYVFGNVKILQYDVESHEDNILQAAYYVGTALLVITFIPQIRYLYVNIVQYFTIGYGQTAVDQVSGLTMRLHYLFIPGVLIRYCAQIRRKRKTYLEASIIILHIVSFLAIGDRGSGLALLITLIWIKAYHDEAFSIKRYIIPVVLLVLAIPVIKYYRIYYTASDSGAFSEALNYVLTNNPIIDILLETGGGQRILLMTISKVNVEGFAYGKAYLDFFIKMLPSSMGIHQFYGTLSKWVINTTGYQTAGFTIWAEAYLNFGFFGIPFMWIIGLVFKYFMSTENELATMRTAIILYFFADVARRSISEYGYNLVYDILLPIIVIYYVSFNVTLEENGEINK